MKKIISLICSVIATLGPVGYLPMPGTMGTLCTLPLLVGLRRLQEWIGFIDEGIFVLLCVFAAVWVIDKALMHIDGYDPSEIVLDEVIGFIVTMIFFPLNVYTVIFGFLYFRFFDIVKPLGIYNLQHIPGSWGIVLDDLAAAVFARMALHVTLIILQ